MRIHASILAALLWAALPASGWAGAAAPAAGPEAARSYRIETEGTTRALTTGATGRLVLAIVPLDGTHVHPAAPLKIGLAASEGLSLARAQLGHADAVDPGADAPRFEVPFTATAAGAQEARAKVDFYLCSDRWCVKQTRDVAVAIDVK